MRMYKWMIYRYWHDIKRLYVCASVITVYSIVVLQSKKR